MFGIRSAESNTQKRWQIWLILAFLVLAGFSIVQTWVIRHSVHLAQEAEARVDLCNGTKLILANLLSTAEHAKSQHRAYLLTRDNEFEKQIKVTRTETQNAIDSMRSKGPQIGIDEPAVNTLRQAFEKLFESIEESIRIVKRSSGKIRFVKESDSSEPIDLVRLEVQKISHNLDVISIQAERTSSDLSQTVSKLNVIGAVLSAILIILVFLLTKRLINDQFTQRLREEQHALELDQSVRDRTKELIAAKDELEAFSYSVSHDLRAPLRATISYAGMLEEDYGEKLDDEARQYLDRIKVSGKRMNDLIDTLLLLSRMSRAEMNVEEVDASEIAETILTDLQKSNPSTPRKWSVQPGILLTADRKMLTTLLDNLLRNAWKFSSRVVAPTIVVAYDPSNHEVSIEDNGAGFDPKHAGSLFVPFQRLHNDREFEGTGIGLAIVQRLVNRHNGVIRAESEEGKGAKFTFRLGNVNEAVSPIDS